MVQPGLRSLHHLPMEAQATAMFSDAMRQEWLNPQGSQQLPMEFRAIGLVSLNSVWPTARPAKFATHRRNPSREGPGQQLGHIVTVSAGQDGGQGDSIGVCNQVMFTARFTPVRGIGSRCSPPPQLPNARMAPLSTILPRKEDQSIWSASHSLGSSSSSSLCQTPGFLPLP